uniref:MATH domain-containing protein n=1 Tax=Graphocephala atropunctata TaxID=36148 RepID=A0A1B6MUZ3_9HEMI
MTDCKLCKRRVCAKDILKHVKQQHPSCKIFTAEMKEMSLTDFEYGEQGEWFAPFVVHGQFLWEVTSIHPASKLLIETFYAVPNGKPKDKLYCKVMFDSEETKFVSKINLNLDPDVDDDENSVTIPWRTVPNYVDSDGKFFHKIQITKK